MHRRHARYTQKIKPNFQKPKNKVPRTNFATVVESLPKQSKQYTLSPGIAWYAPHAPATSIFVPYFSKIGNDIYTGPYQKGNRFEFKRDNAWWAFNFVSNHMAINYQNMSQIVIPKLESLQNEVVQQTDIDVEKYLQKKGFNKIEFEEKIEKLRKHVVEKWWHLADQLIVQFNDNSFQPCFNQPTNKQRSESKCGSGSPKAILFPDKFLNDIKTQTFRPQSVQPGDIVQIDHAKQIGENSPVGAPWKDLPTPFPTIRVDKVLKEVDLDAGSDRGFILVVAVVVAVLFGYSFLNLDLFVFVVFSVFFKPNC